MKGVPVPQNIELKDGHASADVDIIKTIGAFLLNVLGAQSIERETSDARKLFDHIYVQTAAMHLRPGAFCKFGEKKFHVGAGSKLVFSDLDIDSNLNYEGSCLFHVHFLGGSQWIGERINCSFNGGDADVRLSATRFDNELQLFLKNKEQRITLHDCTFQWGKGKRSQAHSTDCVLALKEFKWSKKQGAAHPVMHVLATMQLKNTMVDVKTDTQETQAEFPEVVPAKLALDFKQNSRETQFNTEEPEQASQAKVEINRADTNLAIWLTKAKIGPISLDKFGDVNFSLSTGSAQLKKLTWSTAKRTFTLSTSGSSTLSLPRGMMLSFNGEPGSTRMTLPIRVRLGDATLDGINERLKLSNLNGDLLVRVDKDVQINSNMDLTIDSSSFLGKNQAQVKAQGFELSSNQGRAVAHIKSCKIDLTDEALEEAIREQVPKSKTFEINKTFEKQKWRYKDATIDRATVNNLHIDSMEHNSKNVIDFTASGDADVFGTVEKGGFLAAIGKDSGDWEKKPWTARGFVKGDGKVAYKLVPNSSLYNSELQYDLSMSLPIPDDVDLDWSQVSTGIMQSAERAIIVGQMKKITVPVKFSGKLRICDEKDRQWRFLKISHLTVEPSPAGTQLSFSADATF